MSRLTWAVFLAAIFGITLLPCQRGDRREAARGEGVSDSSPSNVEGARNDFVVERAAGASPAEGVFVSGTARATTTGTVSVKLSDIPVGKVIQVGTVKFVKVSADQYLAINLCPDGSTYSSYYKGCVVKTTTYSYTGSYQTFTAPATGTYVVELWGAAGSGTLSNAVSGKGGYSSGNINLQAQAQLYVYVGESGTYTTTAIGNTVTFGGGGKSCNNSSEPQYGRGGGATDIRTINGNWNDSTSLRSRIMVAGAGGAGTKSSSNSFPGGNAGGLISYVSLNDGQSRVANQTSGYQFGIGKNGDHSVAWAGSGGGWYGGYGPSGCSDANNCRATVGGSSYISGHTGCVAVTSTSSSSPKSGCTTGTTNNSCSITPYVNPATGSGYTFTNTTMIDGAGYAWTNVKGSLQPMPSPESVGAYYASGVGHTGNGAARITQLSVYLGI